MIGCQIAGVKGCESVCLSDGLLIDEDDDEKLKTVKANMSKIRVGPRVIRI